MKTILLQRINDNGYATQGILRIDGIKLMTIEDTFRKEKIKHKTRIHAGEYEIKLRTFGSHHEKYSKRFTFHKGMLQIMDVTGFTDILIHIGNSPEDTSGCVLVGEKFDGENRVINSTSAYIKLYKYLIKLIESGEEIKINIMDNE